MKTSELTGPALGGAVGLANGITMNPATKTAYLFTVESDYDGEPCLLGVRYCRIVPGNPYCRDSDVDYYGFREIDFDVLRPDGELWVEADEAVTRSLRLRELYEDDIEGAWR